MGGAGRGVMVGSGDGGRERARMLNLERGGRDKGLLFSGSLSFSGGVWLVSSAAGGGASHRAITDADSLRSVSPIL